MYRLILHISIALLFIQTAFCQVRTIKPVKKKHPSQSNLTISAGLAKSVLFLTRNVKQNNDAYGFNGALMYGGQKVVRGTLEYTYYHKINIAPTWYNIRAYTVEANVHFLARFKRTKAFFYPLFGISYNSFSGYFTGIEDFLHLSDKYKINETAKTNWLGLNVGVGYEQFFKQVSIFAEYKMRIGSSSVNGSKQLNIMDVYISAGLRYTLKVPSVYKIFRGTKSRYVLESKPAQD